MSTMYRATDVRLGRSVALKIMSDALAGDAEFRERFVDEARNTSAIDHPHVVPLYDFGDLDGMLFLAMRYVEGADLSSLLSDGPLAPRRALLLLGQVAEALDVVHLDVKPANVLVTHREGSGAEHAYLADFGLTRRGTAGHRTRGGDFLGSPTYAAPEHLRGDSVDARTDVYSLACMLFACLTGHAPFTGTVDEVINGHLAGMAPSVSAEVVLPARVDTVVRRGMATEPDARPGSCRELMTLAHQALSGTTRPEEPPVRRATRTGQQAGGPWVAPEPSGPSRPVAVPQAPPVQLMRPEPARQAPQPAPQPPGPHASGPHASGPHASGPHASGQPSWGSQSSGPQPRGAPPQPRPLGPPPAGPSDVASMRLRDPMPTRTSTAFTAEPVAGRRWVVPAVVAAAVLLLVALLLLLL
jgi:serine/threonine protein kinase